MGQIINILEFKVWGLEAMGLAVAEIMLDGKGFQFPFHILSRQNLNIGQVLSWPFMG